LSERHDLDRLRARLLWVEINDAFRIIPERYSDRALDSVPSPSRFSDPRLGYAVVYAASTVRCALWETLLRDRFIETGETVIYRSVLEQRSLVVIRSREPLNLIDLRADGTTLARVPTAVTRDRRQSAGQALSQSVYHSLAEADGFLYSSRLVNDDCIAVFDRACERLEAPLIYPLARSPEVHSALDDDQISVVSSLEDSGE